MINNTIATIFSDVENNQDNELIKDFNEFISQENEIRSELKKEDANKRQLDNKVKSSSESHLLGNLVEVSYETATLITNDYYTFNNGGIPKSSFLIATLNQFSYNKQDIPEHFILLQVQETTGTPASPEMKQTYYSWIKRANPELDDFTKGDLTWNALKCRIKGMFYKNKHGYFEYSADLNILFSPLHYIVYKPNNKILNIILNSDFLNKQKKAEIENKPFHLIELGSYRAIENNLLINENKKTNEKVFAKLEDFLGRRTAMFGKTRLGKSNTVKLIIKNIIQLTNHEKTYSVGQLIFDINGEYAFINEKDGTSIKEMFKENCEVYTLNPNKPEYKELKINFFENAKNGMQILKDLLYQNGEDAHYVKSFSNLEISNPEEIKNYAKDVRLRPLRKLLFYWAILVKAGFQIDENKELNLLKEIESPSFDFGLNSEAIKLIWGQDNNGKNIGPKSGKTLEDLKEDVYAISSYIKSNGHSELKSTTKKPLFDEEDLALINFFQPKSGTGATILREYQMYHSQNAVNYKKEIIEELDQGKTIILDLSNANDSIRRYFADLLSKAVFAHQEKKFSENNLKNNYIQMYFEEAHNVFKINNPNDVTDIYSRIAKEGAKFQLGIVYSTQSPSTINKELLIQTENFFIGHISSPTEVKALCNLNIEFNDVEDDILKIKQVGYMRVITNSHRFVIPVQINEFNKEVENGI
jgi:hypothetical protein